MTKTYGKRIKGLFQGRTRVIRWEPHKLLYVRVPKSGNSSIRHSIEGGEKHRMTSAAIIASARDWTTFSFVRNPWSRLVSTFRHKASQDSDSRRMTDGVYQGFLDAGLPIYKDMGFEEFCEIVCSVPDSQTDKHLRSQSSFLIRRNKPIVSFIGRIETMESDWQSLMELAALDCAISHLNKTRRKHYRHYFSSQNLINLVGDRYAKDIHFFGYDF